MKLIWVPRPGAAEGGDPYDGEWIDDGLVEDAGARDPIDNAVAEGSLIPSEVDSGGVTSPIRSEFVRRFLSTFKLSREGIKPLLAQGIGDPTKEAAVNAVIAQLRDLRNKDGELTQAALLLRAMEHSGMSSAVSIIGRFYGVERGFGTTTPQNHDGTEYGIPNRLERGESVLSQIVFDADAPNAVAVLAHELVHAAQYMLGDGRFRDSSGFEVEPTKIGNEAYAAIKMERYIYDNYENRTPVPGWNDYIPWINIAPNGKF